MTVRLPTNRVGKKLTESGAAAPIKLASVELIGLNVPLAKAVAGVR